MWVNCWCSTGDLLEICGCYAGDHYSFLLPHPCIILKIQDTGLRPVDIGLKVEDIEMFGPVNPIFPGG